MAGQGKGFKLTDEHLSAIGMLPPDLQGAVHQLANDHRLSLVDTRRLVALLRSQPTLSLPVALAMVQAVGKSRVGEILGRIEQALEELPEAHNLTGSERRMVLVILELLQEKVSHLRRVLLGL